MLFAAATDHRYLDRGHTLDFVNKALEALDVAGWERAEAVLTSLAPQLAFAERMEEANSWRHPVDIVALLEGAFDELPQALRAGAGGRGTWSGRAELVETVLTAEPGEILEGLLQALRDGADEVHLASAVSYAAATRIARFPTCNEFGDWDTALHTFTFANAVEQGLRRSPSPELVRGVLDAAMSVHLDRFLNVPATRLPEPETRKYPRGGARGPGAAARRAAARRRCRPARCVVSGLGGQLGRARVRARVVPATREPELPHHPVRRGGRAAA